MDSMWATFLLLLLLHLRLPSLHQQLGSENQHFSSHNKDATSSSPLFCFVFLYRAEKQPHWAPESKTRLSDKKNTEPNNKRRFRKRGPRPVRPHRATDGRGPGIKYSFYLLCPFPWLLYNRRV